MEYKLLWWIAGCLLAYYLLRKYAAQTLYGKRVKAELDRVINSDEHKVKGRYE